MLSGRRGCAAGRRARFLGDVGRENLRWTGRSTGTEKSKLVKVVSLDNDQWPKLDWKTLFVRDERYREPIASVSLGDDKKGGPPPEPLSQEQMRQQFDVSKMVEHSDAPRGSRQSREYRNQRMVAKHRVFTESMFEAMTIDDTPHDSVDVPLDLH